MISLQSSQDTDGLLEMDELEDLLREEEFENDYAGSDGSEEIIFKHSTHHLSYKRKKYLQGLPTNGLVRQIVKRWEDEGSPLPFYLFWPWPFIRSFCYGIFLMGWLAITVTAFWPVIRMMLFPRVCINGPSEDSWSDGSVLRVDLDPNTSLTVYGDIVELESLGEYNVKLIYLSSSDWWMSIVSANESSSAGITDTINQLSDVCRIHGIKIIMAIFISQSKELLEARHKKDGSAGHGNVLSVDSTAESPVNISKSEDDVMIYQSLIDAGISGFYVEDDPDKLTSSEIKELVNIFTLVNNHSSSDILFGMDDNPYITFPPVAITGFDLNPTTFSSAADLDELLDNRFENGSQVPILWKISRNNEKDDSTREMFTFNLRLLRIVLPGSPMLDDVDMESMAAGPDPSPVKVLLSLRQHSLALKKGESSLLKEYKHLEKNAFAMLRSFKGEKRYLIIWNFSNSTVSLDFRHLTMEGRWVFRSVMSAYTTVKLRSIKDVQPSEFGLIELPDLK